MGSCCIIGWVALGNEYAHGSVKSHDGFTRVFLFAVNLETVCADDLLSVLLYLLVKTEIPNW